MSVTETVYNHSPLILQNMMISAYGLKLRHMRYGGNFSQYYASAKNRYQCNVQKLQDIQNKLLYNIVRAAVENTQYYRDTIRINARDLDSVSVETLKEFFPVLDKQVLREKQAHFYNQGIAKSKLQYINTSGTSGTPLRIAVTRDAIQKNYAFFARFLDLAGVSWNDRSATFAGRVFIPEKQTKPPYWRYNLSNNNLLLSSYRISDSTIPAYLGALEKWQPRFIDSYPSAIYVVAKYIIDNKVRHSVKPAAIITSSETLIDEHRVTIEKAFGCRVFDHYGCAEMAALITQCAKGNYHINPDYGLVEILNEKGEPAGSGEVGEIVCTGFINDAMPLIRYRLGDSAILFDITCDCGCQFPVLGSIIGRTDDLIITRDGRKVGRLDPVFKGIMGIKETQIVQHDYDNLSLYIVKAKNFRPQELEQLVIQLKTRIDPEIQIDVTYVNEIPRTRSGKFKSVVSHVRH